MVGYFKEHLPLLAISKFTGGNGWQAFFNYKGFYSVVLLAHKYQFLYANVGCQGRISDGGVFKSSDLYRGIQSSSLNIPEPTPLPKTGNPCWEEDGYPNIPYVIVGDDAFQLAEYTMKPFSTKRHQSEEHLVFNYRLSRFRRVSENAFGIFVSRFRLFLGRINIKDISSNSSP